MKGFFSKEVSPVTPGNGGKRGNFTAMTAYYRTSDQNQGYRGNSGPGKMQLSYTMGVVSSLAMGTQVWS